MTFEISLRPPFSLLRVLRAQSESDKSQQDYHWVGPKRDVKRGETNSSDQNKKQQHGKTEQGYRPLSRITLGEVEDALQLFEHQLLPAHENWIGKNCFCKIPLKRKRDGRPPVIFGRVKSCYPSDGQIDNIEEIQLTFPRMEDKPDAILITKSDISIYSNKPVESYYMRVRFLASPEDMADFAEADPIFMMNGFVPEFDPNIYDILEMTEMNQSAYPWLYVISSRWLASVPESLHEEVRAKLEKMLLWKKQIFNYHPNWLANEINTLNRVLGYKYGFTSTVLTEPENPQETIYIIQRTFNDMLNGSTQQEQTQYP
jgi:hypothetical protein